MKSPTLTGMRLWRERLFGTPLTSVITLLLGGALVWLLIPIVRWALLDANWTGTTRADCTQTGACWVFIKARFGQFMYGLYPVDQRWRVDLAGIITLASVIALLTLPQAWRLRMAAATLLILPPLVVWLLAGGFGLVYVETRQWGGLMLTLFLAVSSSLIAVPLGIIMALGRQSELRLIRTLSVIFIEFWRGVPIIAVIFLASLLLPLILPAGVGIDRLARA